MLGPERGERPLRRVEPALGAGRFLPGPLDPGPLAGEARVQLVEPDPIRFGLALGPGQHLLAPREGLAQVPPLAPELGDRFLRPPHLGPHLQGRPVPLVVSVRGLPVRRPRPLEPRLDRPLPRAGRLELHLLGADRGAARLRLALQTLPAKGQQLGPQAALLRLEDGVALRLRGLALEAGEVLVELLAEIAQPVEVVVRLAHPALGLAPPLAVQGDAGRLLEETAQLLRPGLDETRDRALLDDGVAARAKARAEKEIGDVAPPAPRAVQVVDGLALAVDDPPDRDLLAPGETPAGPAFGVVEEELDRGLADRPARGGAVEDHVHEELAAKLARRALPHYPAYRVDDVGLAAAVGPDHPDEIAGEVDRDRIDERLEPGEPDLAQPHVSARPDSATPIPAGSAADPGFRVLKEGPHPGGYSTPTDCRERGENPGE